MVIVREFSNLFDMSASSAESVKYCFQISTILHGNNSQLIFLINPYEESLVLIMEDTSSIWPISVQTNRLKESISFLKEEMIIDELLSLCLSHVVKRVVSTSEVSSKTFKCLNNT